MGKPVDRPVYVFHLRSEKDEPPDVIRLRQLLKTLGRHYGFDCVYVNDLAKEPPRQLQPPPAKG